jgi:hypothetical protein
MDKQTPITETIKVCDVMQTKLLHPKKQVTWILITGGWGMKAFAFVLSCFFSVTTWADVSVSGGKVVINVSGGDASTWGGNGGRAGDVDVTLSYTDATKSTVAITGTAGRTNISHQIPIKDLKSIQIYTNGFLTGCIPAGWPKRRSMDL